MKAVLENMRSCYGCSACFNACPHDAISMRADDEGFLYPEIDQALCTDCGLCAKICPRNSCHYPNAQEPDCFAFWASDSLRSLSASGGVFSALARHILDQNGVVCGVVFSEDFTTARHVIVDRYKDIAPLRKSKYMQSEIGRIYKDIKAHLNGGRKVLFVGCPCQVAGLNAYLSKPYDNLLTADLVCHSIASPLAWQRFLEEVAEGRRVKKVDLRFKGRPAFYRKKRGWSSTTHIKFSSGKSYTKGLKECAFERAYSPLYCVRPCCSTCQFARKSRQGDLTIGDFWGVKAIDESWDDRKGTSLLLINNQKGNDAFLQLQQKKLVVRFQPLPLKQACAKNGQLFKSPRAAQGRDIFFEELKKGTKFSHALKIASTNKQ